MNISKTLFKNLSRCHNFMALYDLYINRSFHNIKAINTKKKSTEIMKDIFLLNNNLFDKKKEKIEELLSEMFDENTGEDLLNLKSDIVLNLFHNDLEGEKSSKNLLLVLPAGKAAHIESGIAYGLGKKCYAIGEYEATDTLYNIFEEIFSNETELEAFLKKYTVR